MKDYVFIPDSTPYSIQKLMRKELCWFELDYPNVYLNWDKLEPAIASWIFLLEAKINELKKHCKAERKLIKDMEHQTEHIHNLQENNRALIRKCESLKVINKALVEYRK